MARSAARNRIQIEVLYEMQAEICGALAHPVRLKILDLLDEGEMTSSQLLKRLPIPKANLSQHLTVLKDAGLVGTRKEGLYQYVSLALPKVKDACAIVRGVLTERIERQHKRHENLRRQLKGRR